MVITTNIYKWKYRNSEKGKKKRKEYRLSEAGRKTEEKWRTSKKGKEYFKKYRKNHRFYWDITKKTIRKYGKLKKGFQYHHNTKPYNEDKFIILETPIHKWVHHKLPKLIENKKKYGRYNV